MDHLNRTGILKHGFNTAYQCAGIMKITGGSARGHAISVPKASDLRPAQNIVRQAVFDWLAFKFELQNAKVLDLYAGSGAFGLEALSRKAAFCTFVDHKQTACESIKKTLRHSHLMGKSKIYHQNVDKFVSYQAPKSFDLVFLDPPYVIKIPTFFLDELANLLTDRGIIIYSHAKTYSPPSNTRQLQTADTRRFGASTISFLTKPSTVSKITT